MKSELEQSRQLAMETMLPSLLARKTCKDIYGFKFEPAAHLLHMEQKIMEAITNEEDQSFLMVNCPPRHGKTMFVLYVAAWFLMMYPAKRVIYVSYNDDFAEQGGQQVRTIIERFGPKLFDIRVSKQTSGKGNWQLDSSPLSGMISVGLGSTITGRGADLIIVDDLIKNAEEAGSRATKARHVREYDGTVRSRLEPGGTIIMIATRWAEDDLPGTIWDRCHTDEYAGDPWEFIEFPALAEISETDLEEIYAMHGGDLAERVVERWTDEIGRKQGEALWPKRYSRKILEQIKASMDPFMWGALFQQRPSQRQGGMFPKDAWGYYDPKEMLEVTQRVWVWDTAFTDEGGDWTVGTLWGKFEDGRIGILKHTRFQGDSAKVEAAVKEGAYSVGPVVPIIIEQERAGSGKYLIQSFQKLMPGFNVEGVRPEGTKEERAGPYSAAVINGNVLLPKGASWIKEWHHEHRVFPRGRHDDQVDTGIYAHRHLTMVGAVTVFSPLGLNLDAEREMLLLLAQAGISTRQSAGIG
jgi:predicted phage terminase large subunit-like protein